MEKETYEELIKKIAEGSGKQKEFNNLLKEIKENFVERIKQLSHIVYFAYREGLQVGQFTSSQDGQNDFWFFNQNQIAFKSRIYRNSQKTDYEYWYIDQDGNVYRSNYCYDWRNHEFDKTFQINLLPKTEESANKYTESLEFFIANFDAFEQQVIDCIRSC